MRILHVVTLVDDESSYGGPLTVAVNQCTELISRGHDAQILAGWRGRGKPPIHLEGVPARLFPLHTVVPGMRFSGLFSVAMARWLQANAASFDFAHLHAARDLVPLLAGVQLNRAGVSYTTQTHGMVLPDQRRVARVLDRLITLPVLRAADTRFVLTDAEQDAVIDLLDGSSPVTRLANGVSVSLPAPRQAPEAQLDVLFLARLHPRKRVLDFARAAATLIDEGVTARFSVVGPDDGDLPALRDFIETCNLGERLHYEGALPHTDAIDRLRRAGVFVLPSVDEPFPMTLLEALAHSVPSICTSSCGLADDLRQDDAAMVIDPGHEPLTEALRRLIDDPELRRGYAQRAAVTADKRYSVESVGDVLVRTYTRSPARQPEALPAQTEKPDPLLWVTNIPTPYRAPLWAALAELHPLTVALLGDGKKNRQWEVKVDDMSYAVVRLHATPMANSRESAIYAPSRQLLALLRNRPRAIVLDGWESPALLAARWLAHRMGVPLIASYRSTMKTHRFSRGPVPALRRWFFRGSDIVLTAGEASTEAVVRMGVPRHRVVEGFNTVDVARFQAGACAARQRLPHQPGHHFLYVGQFIKRKNINSLISAFELAREPLDTLTLVGTGPEEAALRRLVEAHDLGDLVRFAGHLDGDDLVTAYAAANTFVLPSSEEVWGLVVNEALAAGLHAVVTRGCSITPSIDHMPGVSVTGSDVEGLAKGLRHSRARWTGPIENHPITKHTPLALAEIVLGSIGAIDHGARGNAA